MSQYRQEQCEKMLAAVTGAGYAGMSRKQFAELLGIKKGKHLNSLIDELISRNLVHKVNGVDNHNRPLFIYVPVAMSQAEYDVQS